MSKLSILGSLFSSLDTERDRDEVKVKPKPTEPKPVRGLHYTIIVVKIEFLHKSKVEHINKEYVFFMTSNFMIPNKVITYQISLSL